MALRMTICALALALQAGCAPTRVCDEPQPYEAARPGPEIVAPDDLDNLQGSSRSVIPEAARAQERAPEDPCLDYPPVLRSGTESN